MVQKGDFVLVNYLLSTSPIDRAGGVVLGFVTAKTGQRLSDEA
jgi:hypothetical protein